MTDTLLILPTIGANVEKALEALKALNVTLPTAMPSHLIGLFMPLDEHPTDTTNFYANGVQERIVFDVSPTRRGLVAAYRAGFKAFTEYVPAYERLVLLEDNVRVTGGWFEALTRTLDAHPEFGWVACGQQENPNAPFTSLCSMMTRAAALATDGGPDLAFAPCQFDDGDMFMRLLAKGFRPHAIPHLVSHPEARTSREGTIEDDWRLIEAHRAIFQARWGVSEFHWNLVPVHRGCSKCTGVP